MLSTNILYLFAEKRKEVEGIKYISEDGTNKSRIRDTIQDIAEEVSDIFIIARLLLEEYQEKGATPAEMEMIYEILGLVDDMWDVLICMNNRETAITQVDKDFLNRPAILSKSLERMVGSNFGYSYGITLTGEEKCVPHASGKPK